MRYGPAALNTILKLDPSGDRADGLARSVVPVESYVKNLFRVAIDLLKLPTGPACPPIVTLQVPETPVWSTPILTFPKFASAMLVLPRMFVTHPAPLSVAPLAEPTKVLDILEVKSVRVNAKTPRDSVILIETTSPELAPKGAPPEPSIPSP